MPAAPARRRHALGRAALWTVAALAAIAATAAGRSSATPADAPVAVWPAFGYDAAGSNNGPATTGITSANLGQLEAKIVHLPGIVDSSPVYVRDAVVGGTRHDVYVVDTAYGRTFAIDAESGAILWQFVPPGIANFEDSLIITTSSPVVDPGLRYVYSASPEGRVHKLSLATGREVGGRWPVLVTYDPTKEKISSSLEVRGPYVLVVLAGLSEKMGKPFPRVGHLVAIARNTGRIAYVFNAVCSDRRTVIPPSTCDRNQSGIWARIPAPIDAEGNYLVATADGYWDGRRNWGDSVLELSPMLRPLQSYTPANHQQLALGDLDLGSSAPAQLTDDVLLQAGKDGILRLLDLRKLNGKRHAAGPFVGGELSTTAHAPGTGAVLSQPAVWRRKGLAPWVFVANDFGIEGLSLALRPHPHLRLMWSDGRPGSSPVIAGGLLYAYNVDEGGLSIYDPVPETGTRLPNEPLLTLSIPRGHWNSPVVADGRIALGDGNANSHLTSGDFYIWSLPRS